MNNWHYALIGSLCFFVAASSLIPLDAQTKTRRPAGMKPAREAAPDSARLGETAVSAGPDRDALQPGSDTLRPENDMLQLQNDTLHPDKDTFPDKPDKDEIRLNETFRKAIESGRFLPSEPGSFSLPGGGDMEGGLRLPPNHIGSGSHPVGSLRAASGHLPLAADFSEYLGPDPFLTDTLRRMVDSAGLTPQLFILQHWKPRPAPVPRKEAYTPRPRVDWNKGLRLGKLPVHAKVSAGNLFLEEVRDGQRRGSINVTVTGRFSMEDLLQKIFWKSARNKARNRKRENTWKYYNDMP